MQRDRDGRPVVHDRTRQARGDDAAARRRRIAPARQQVDVDGELAALLHRGGHTPERPRRIRRVVEHADRVGQVEGLVAEGQREDVGLHQVGGRQARRFCGRRVDRAGEIDPDDLSPPARHHLGVTPGAHARVEHEAARGRPRAPDRS